METSTIVIIVVGCILVISLIVFLIKKFPEAFAAITEIIGDIFSIF